MQVLWSRAAKVRSCRCGSCLQPATAVARRATTSGPTKRRLKAGDIFTACYTAMFATAAMADLKVKEDRRKQWDKAIETERAKLEGRISDDRNSPETFVSQRPQRNLEPRSTSRFSLHDGYEKSDLIGHIPAVWNGLDWALLRHQRFDTSLEAQLRILDSHMKQASTLIILEEGDIIYPAQEQTGEDLESYVSQTFAREPKNRLHLDKMEDMVSSLVLKLLLQTKAFTPKTATLVRDSTVPDLKQIRAPQAGTILSGRTRLPSYLSVERPGIAEERKRLDQSIISVLSEDSPTLANADLVIAKVCYNLLISNAPPSVTTYTIMIKHLTRLEYHDLAQVVIDSLMTESRFKPNELTLAAMLDHYRVIRDAEGFQRLIQQMRGWEPGLRTKKRAVCDLIHPAVRKWALDGRVVQRNGYLYELAPRTSHVCNALIRGSLELLSIRRALYYLKFAVKHGIQIAIEVFNAIVDRCTATTSEKAKIHLLAVLSHQFSDHSNFHGGITYDSHVRERVYIIMRSCNIDPTYTDERTLPNKFNRILFSRMVRHMHFEEVRDAFNGYATRVSKLEHRLASVMSKDEVKRLSAELGLAETELISSIYKDLPSPRQKKYNEAVRVAPNMTLAERFDVLFGLWREWASGLAVASNEGMMGSMPRIEVA